MKINIAYDLNIPLLNDKLNEFAINNLESPIMIMSPETMNKVTSTFQKFDGVRLGESNLVYTSNIVGIYHGYKVFTDPTMKYGEVDIR